MGLKENKCTSLQNFILRKHLEWLVTSVSFKQIAETHFQQKKLDMMLQKTYEFSILLFSYCEDQFAFANMKWKCSKNIHHFSCQHLVFFLWRRLKTSHVKHCMYFLFNLYCFAELISNISFVLTNLCFRLAYLWSATIIHIIVQLMHIWIFQEIFNKFLFI